MITILSDGSFILENNNSIYKISSSNNNLLTQKLNTISNSFLPIVNNTTNEETSLNLNFAYNMNQYVRNSDSVEFSNLKITGDTLLCGNLTIIPKEITQYQTTAVNIGDTLIELATDNISDNIDIGIYGKYISNNITKYSGFFRDSQANGIFKLFKDISIQPGTNINISNYINQGDLMVNTLYTAYIKSSDYYYDINIQSKNGNVSNNNGGNIILTPGSGYLTGNNGKIIISSLPIANSSETLLAITSDGIIKNTILNNNNIPTKNNINTFIAKNYFTNSIDLSGGNLTLNSLPIYLKNDINHGLQYGTNWNIDGPILFGLNGGALGYTNNGNNIALKWDTTGNIIINNNLTVNGRYFGIWNGDSINITYTDAKVKSVNGLTGDVILNSSNGVTSVNGLTGVVTFNYVSSINGLTGAITNIPKIDISNTFSAINTFSNSISLTGGNIKLNTLPIYLVNDIYHGLQYGSSWGLDGPVLFGFANGALGTTSGGNKRALSWDTAQNINFYNGIYVQNGINLYANKVLDLGYNASNRTGDAGKIGYEIFDAGCLNIIGAGTGGGIRTVKIYDNLTVSNSVNMTNLIVSNAIYLNRAQFLDLGYGATREANAGKISYDGFDNGYLTIVGAGTTNRYRKIMLYDSVTVMCDLLVNENLTIGGFSTFYQSIELLNGKIDMNKLHINLGPKNEYAHGLGYGTTWSVDGPALYGYAGGVLGTTVGGNKNVLKWDSNGDININNNANIGHNLTVTANINSANIYSEHISTGIPANNGININISDKNGLYRATIYGIDDGGNILSLVVQYIIKKGGNDYITNTPYRETKIGTGLLYIMGGTQFYGFTNTTMLLYNGYPSSIMLNVTFEFLHKQIS